MSWQLKYRQAQRVPVEVEGITPAGLAGKSIAQVEKLPIMVGNREVPLAELFDVSGDDSNDRIDLFGDLSGVHWIGAKMQGGLIHVHGDAGRHVGSEMNGGRIDVEGNAGDWVGAELRQGRFTFGGVQATWSEPRTAVAAWA